MIYLDTSAFIAILDRDDKSHPLAKKTWEKILQEETPLICSDYILVETLALIQNRLGIEATRSFQEDIFPLLGVTWVNETIYHAGISSVLTAARKKLSFVDCVSFEVMRKLGIRRVFTFDRHFEEQGFHCVP